MDLDMRLNLLVKKLSDVGVNLGEQELTTLKEALDLYKRAIGKVNYSDIPGHGIEHTFRVLELSIYLWDREGGDFRKIVLAALFHDIDINPKKDHALRSARLAKEILGAAGHGDIAEDVARIIEEHSYSSGKKPSSLESAILQDADRLDALGAIGVARVFVYSGAIGRELYGFPDYRSSGALKHFYDKIIKLSSTFNTRTAINVAKRRVEFVRKFIEEFEREIMLRDLR